ncbi:hypothetical protein DOT_4141 [Desulfosporosinus sp. OT]|nr:hypothetical protein DOT_4141 [Desulfosporosinus sp. OT]
MQIRALSNAEGSYESFKLHGIISLFIILFFTVTLVLKPVNIKRV